MDKIKLAVIGSRGFNDKERLFNILDKNIDRIEYLVSGGCPNSPDSLAEEWCRYRGKGILIIYPDWDGLGKRAGMVRNEDIIRSCDKALILWDGKSKGTANSIEWCKKLNKEHKIINFND